MKSTVSEDQRIKNVVILGLQEEGQHDKLRARFRLMVKLILDGEKLLINNAISKETAKDGVCRPVRVTFESKEVAI